MKLRIPFLSTSTDSAIEKISTALAAMNHARAAEQQLHDALVAANERASELLGKIERAKDHRTLIQERMQRETDKDTGEIPASLLAALAVAEQECRALIAFGEQAARLAMLKANSPVSVSGKAPHTGVMGEQGGRTRCA
ncbi:MAG: hypothetical protein IPM11_01565 [Micropruina sp.]|nr:hypothetical protein [Micropruina sp.]